jgi:tripartite-type tricarboxylate transporter receptor subunit TctC
MLITRRRTAAASVLLLAAGAVCAQEKFPNKPIRILVGFTAGSVTDLLARAVGQKLSESWGQQIVVDNRAGAGGVIASDILKGATPDGYTLMVASSGHAVNASLYSKLPYDTLKDFAGITFLADVPNVLVVSPSLGLKSVRDLIELAKSKPGQINYGSAGVGSGTHMNGEVFSLAAGINVVHVPYKGSPEAISSVIGGSVQYYFAPITGALPLLKAGRITGLAVSTKDRSPVLPNIPTVAESGGLPGFDYSVWYGMLGPARMPKNLKDKLAQEIARILALQDVRERMLTQGATLRPTSPEEFDRFIKDEVERMAKIIKGAGIRIN